MKGKADSRKERFTAYISDNQQRLYRFAYSYMKNEEDALDALQEAIVKALSSLDKLREERYLGTWFYRILINECNRMLKANQKYCSYSGEEEQTESWEESYLQKTQVLAQVGELSEKYKSIILLRYFEDRKIAEIADILQINENTVKSRLYKALKILKEGMKEV